MFAKSNLDRQRTGSLNIKLMNLNIMIRYNNQMKELTDRVMRLINQRINVSS